MSRIGANLATLLNGVWGTYAIYSILAGNPRWAGLLIVAGVGFDGLDGILARRSGTPASVGGRMADSIADAITFGIAPALLVADHTANVGRWAPYEVAAIAVGGLLLVLAIARLVYFTARGYARSDFLGVPTPQTALAIVLLGLWADVPGYLGVAPGAVLLVGALAAVLMVLPIPYPKLRRGAPLRGAMAVTAVALVAAEIPLQFRPDPGSPLGLATEGAVAVATAGLLLYYVVGPFTVPPERPAHRGTDA